MKKQTDSSGHYVPYADGGSSAWPSGVFFTSAKPDSLATIHRNSTFVPRQTHFPSGKNPPKIKDNKQC